MPKNALEIPSLRRKGYMAVQEGTYDITPFSLLHCHVNSYRLIVHQGDISVIGRNRPFFSILGAVQTIFGTFSWQNASAEWRNGNTVPQMGSRRSFPPVRPT